MAPAVPTESTRICYSPSLDSLFLCMAGMVQWELLLKSWWDGSSGHITYHSWLNESIFFFTVLAKILGLHFINLVCMTAYFGTGFCGQPWGDCWRECMLRSHHMDWEWVLKRRSDYYSLKGKGLLMLHRPEHFIRLCDILCQVLTWSVRWNSGLCIPSWNLSPRM